MRCPKCEERVELKTKLIEGVPIDYCTACNGMWFDQNELQQLLAKNVIPALDHGATAATEDHDAKRILCPTCKEQCIRAKDKGIHYEVCPACKGIWLDGGEFEQFYKSK